MDESFLIKVVGRLGGGIKDMKEVRILNRILRWMPDGISYEADPRHAELLVREYGGGPAVRTPGVKPEKGEDTEQDSPLEGREASHFRSGAARAHYLAMDRADLAFATKEFCRRMSAPSSRDVALLKRVVRYLAGEPRLVYRYAWQLSRDLAVYVDTDFAGYFKTRKSTSGGCALIGTHLIKHWSSTQKVVTLSSGEAELAGIVKGSAEALGLQSLAQDLGISIDVRVYADSSAAIGICRRSGIGRIRHLAVGQLWVQEKVRSGEIALYKVAGTANPADILTKHMTRDTLDRHLSSIRLHRAPGRAETAPQIVAG